MARDILRTRIEAIQSGWRRTLLWTEVWTGVLLLTGLVVATGLVDLLLPLPAAWRIALWYLGPLLAVAGIVYLIATRKQRRIDSTRAALLAEKRYPHLQDRFVSAVEYSQREAPSTPVGTHLVDRLLSEARTDARKLSFSGVVPGGRLYRRIAAATLTVGSLWVLGAAFPETVGAQLIRVLQPWRPVPPVLATRIDVEPGDVTLRRGSDQVLRALLSGPPVAEATLHVRRGDGGWQSRPMEAAGADTFAYELYAVDGDLGYFVTAEDARSDTFHIQVYEPPELRQVTVRYTFPSYTDRPVEVSHAGHVRAVRGTQVELTARYSKDLREAFLAMATQDTLAAEIDGALARYAFSLTDSTTYGLLARDRQGHADETPRQFPIDAVPDAAPLVRFADPGGDVWAIPSDVVPVSLAATDDFGLSDLLFHYSIAGGNEQSLRMGDFAAPGATRSDGDHTFNLRLLGATTGSVITYHAEAGDYHAPEAQRTLSDLQLISVKPYQERLSGFGGQCQAACQLLSSLQAALLHDTWQLLRSPRPGGRLEAAADSPLRGSGGAAPEPVALPRRRRSIPRRGRPQRRRVHGAGRRGSRRHGAAAGHGRSAGCPQRSAAPRGEAAASAGLRKRLRKRWRRGRGRRRVSGLPGPSSRRCSRTLPSRSSSGATPSSGEPAISWRAPAKSWPCRWRSTAPAPPRSRAPVHPT